MEQLGDPERFGGACTARTMVVRVVPLTRAASISDDEDKLCALEPCCWRCSDAVQGTMAGRQLPPARTGLVAGGGVQLCDRASPGSRNGSLAVASRLGSD